MSIITDHDHEKKGDKPTEGTGVGEHVWAPWIPMYDYRMIVNGWWRRCEICHRVQERPDYRYYRTEEQAGTHD